MSLGSFSRGSADFGRSALNVVVLIGRGDGQVRSRCRPAEKCDGGYWRLMAARRASGIHTSSEAQIIDRVFLMLDISIEILAARSHIVSTCVRSMASPSHGTSYVQRDSTTVYTTYATDSGVDSGNNQPLVNWPQPPEADQAPSTRTPFKTC